MGNKKLTRLQQELEAKSRQMDKVQKDCEKLLKVKDEFISVVSHELRTPLSIIKEGINLTLDEVGGKITPKQKKFLSVSKQNIERLSNLINDLLDISKIEAKRIVLRKSLIGLEAFIKNIVSSFQSIAQEKKITLSYKLPNKKVSIFVDPDKITQVLNNFISNALKFTKEGGSIRVEVQENPNNIHISVIDTGIGIAKQNLNKMFTKFVQIDRTYGPGEKGTGLGLAISKGLIELHGGRIDVESRLNKGSRFYFSIPKASFEEILREYVKNGIRESQDKEIPFSILVSRIDNFADLEKKYGMVKPRLILGDIVNLIRDMLRRGTDLTIRDSGECAVLLSETDKNGIVSVEQRIREAIAKLLVSKKLAREVQVSFGNSTYPEDAADNIEMIARARAFFEGLYFGKERRRAERRYAKLSIEFMESDSLRRKTRTEGKRERTQSINISRGGMCLFANRKLPLGYSLNIEIKLPQKETKINAMTKVVWIKKVSRLSGFNYKMGLRYERIDPDDLNDLMDFISRL